jgi:hypothetical protein
MERRTLIKSAVICTTLATTLAATAKGQPASGGGRIRSGPFVEAGDGTRLFCRYQASGWFGVCAPRTTPVEIVDRLNREINAGLADAKLKARLADLGATVFAGSPSDFGRHIAAETEKWGKVVQAANIRAD